jgi:hypothetical protein
MPSDVNERRPDPNVLSGVRQAVEDMRLAGMNDVRIGWTLYTIRAAAIQEERLRVEILNARHPPDFSVTGFDLADAIKEKV